MRVAQDLVPEIDSLPTRKRENYPEITDNAFWSFYEKSKDFSLVHVTGFYNVYQSMRYIAENRLRGNIVECGCFLGGIAAFMGLCRREYGMTGMKIILFDTFNGPPIGSSDYMLGTEIHTPASLPEYRDVVVDNIRKAVGSVDDFVFVQGLVEETLPSSETGPLVLLRLDTDFYSSTLCELNVLYPRLLSGGVLIVDDYGLFKGARRATDEYLDRLNNPPLLNRIDIGVWAGVKPSGSEEADRARRTTRWFRRALRRLRRSRKVDRFA